MALPKSVLDLIDFKSYHISRYADTVERLKSGETVQFGPNTKVVILTHSAQVTGTLIDTLTEETNESETESQIFIIFFTSCDVRTALVLIGLIFTVVVFEAATSFFNSSRTISLIRCSSNWFMLIYLLSFF